MSYNLIPGTDLSVSELCLGTGNMGKKIPESKSGTILDIFLELGGNFIDTALIYADWLPGEKGSSEKTIGKWLKRKGLRNQVVLATKGGHPDLRAMSAPRLSPEEICSDLHQSLNNLSVETIDIYWLHRDDPKRPVEEIISALEEHVKSGKIRYYGLSNWRTDRIRDAFTFSRKNWSGKLIANQMLWNLAQVNVKAIDQTLAWMDEAMWDFHCQTKFGAMPYSSQANGIFQKLHVGEKLPESHRMYPDTPNLDILKRIISVSDITGFTISQIVLAYLLSQPFPVYPIIGPQDEVQLKDSWSVVGKRLTKEEILMLENKLNLS